MDVESEKIFSLCCNMTVLLNML